MTLSKAPVISKKAATVGFSSESPVVYGQSNQIVRTRAGAGLEFW